MERTLSVLDYAVLLISGADGIQGHVETLWHLLKRYDIPTFIFVNKMDQPGTDKARLLDILARRLDSRCINFDNSQPEEDFLKTLQYVMKQYLNNILSRERFQKIRSQRLLRREKYFRVISVRL